MIVRLTVDVGTRRSWPRDSEWSTPSEHDVGLKLSAPIETEDEDEEAAVVCAPTTTMTTSTAAVGGYYGSDLSSKTLTSQPERRH